MHKNSLDCYEGPKSLELGFGDFVAHHHCYPDSGNGGVDPVGQDSEPDFGADYCCGFGNFDCGSGCLTLIINILTSDIVF